MVNIKKIKQILLFSAVILFLSSCVDNDSVVTGEAPKVDAQLAFSLVEKCSAVIPRNSGSGGATECVNFLTNEIEKMSLPVELDKWEGRTPDGVIEFCNVISEIPGKSSDFIIVGSHYDTKKLATVPDFAGANDSGSSSGLLLAMMRSIKQHASRPPLSLKFVFFDGEECLISYTENDGLYGSRHLCKKWKEEGKLAQCRGVIVLDMVGDRDLGITIPSGADKGFRTKLLKIASIQDKKQFFSIYSRDIIDDHTPFQREKIPTIDIIDFNFGECNRYWHTKADSMDKISPESLATVGNATLELLWNIR